MDSISSRIALVSPSLTLAVTAQAKAMIAKGDMLSIDDVLDILAIELIGVIPEDESILVSSNQGMPLAMSGTNGASAGQAFRNVAQRLDGVNVPLLNLTYKAGFMERLREWLAGAN